MTQTKVDSIPGLMTRMASLETARAYERAKLERAFLLELVFPGCFDEGGCTTRVISNCNEPWNATFVLTRGDKLQEERPVLDVPLVLWRSTFDVMRETAHVAKAREWYRTWPAKNDKQWKGDVTA